jgi:hypothetical protein
LDLGRSVEHPKDVEKIGLNMIQASAHAELPRPEQPGPADDAKRDEALPA